MSAVKFVHILKRIELLERDIQEIHSLQSEINADRSYSNPIKISLEQQVNNLINEKVKLMEVKIENPPEYLSPDKRRVSEKEDSTPLFSFEKYEEGYYQKLEKKRQARRGEIAEPVKSVSKEASERKTEKLRSSSLAEKSLVKKDENLSDSHSLSKRRADLLKDLPPLEY